MITLSSIIAFFGTTIGRYAIIALGGLAFVSAYTWRQQSIGAKKERIKIVKKANAEAKKRNAKARKIRSSNPVAGASARLRQRYGADVDSN